MKRIKSKQKRRLQHIVTRDYLPIVLKCWYHAASSELKKVMGAGFTDVVMHSDGKKAKVYRIADELHTSIKKAMLKYVQSKKYSRDFDKYKIEMEKFRRMIKQNAPIKKIILMHRKLFPVMAISYYVPNIFYDTIPKKNKKSILVKCLAYRKISHSLMDDLNEAVKKYLRKNKLPWYASLDGKKNSWMKKGFVCSKGKFHNTPWQEFLEKNGYSCKEEKSENINALKGMTAYKGKVKGIAKIIHSSKDLPKISQEDILVCPMTQLSHVPFLKKVKAIVTDEGGITTHVAIIAREMKIPAIMGTKHATKFFKDGDIIEVDANNGIIKILKRQPK